jgi:hypothetical protein
MAGRPGRAGWVVQRRATSSRCQRKIVAGVTSSPTRRWIGSSRARAAITARSVQDPWPWRTSLERGELVAQDQDLDLLGGVGSGAQHHPAQELGEHHVGQLQGHRRIMPGGPRLTKQQVSDHALIFGHLQGRGDVAPGVVG